MPTIISAKKFGQSSTPGSVTPILQLVNPTINNSWTDSINGALTWDTATGVGNLTRTTSYFNGNSAFDFTGSQRLEERMTSDIPMTESGYTVFAVLRPRTINRAFLFGLQEGDGNPFAQLVIWEDGRFRFQSSSNDVDPQAIAWSATGAVAANTAYVLAGLIRDDGYAHVFQNGVLAGSSTSTHVPAAGGFDISWIGSFTNGTYFYNGQMAEIRTYDYGLSDEAVSSVSNELMTKYGIA